MAAYAMGRWSGTADQGRRLPSVDRASVPPSVKGQPIVIDGDSLDFGDTRVRLFGVDAFERDQLCLRSDGTHFPCGQLAKGMLTNLVAEGPVSCLKRDVDPYGRMVAVCTVEDFDVAAELVRAGVALAYRHYSNNYVDAEEEAHAARRGAWEGTFTAPWDWRHGKRS